MNAAGITATALAQIRRAGLIQAWLVAGLALVLAATAAVGAVRADAEAGGARPARGLPALVPGWIVCAAPVVFEYLLPR